MVRCFEMTRNILYIFSIILKALNYKFLDIFGPNTPVFSDTLNTVEYKIII